MNTNGVMDQPVTCNFVGYTNFLRLYSVRGFERSELGGSHGAPCSHDIRQIHSAPSLGQSILTTPVIMYR